MTLQKHIRYRLLFDEGLPRKESFPQLHNLHTIHHINHDINKSGLSDSSIYSFARREKYLVIVFNTKDFKPFITKDTSSVIALSTNLTTVQIDRKLAKLLRRLKPSEKKGYLISLTNEGEQKKRYA